MKRIHYLLIFCILMDYAISNPLTAQISGQEKSSASIPGYACEEEWIEVLFDRHSRVRMRNNSLIDLETNALEGVTPILGVLSWHQWHRMTDLPEPLLDQWETNGEQRTGEDLYNLNNIFRLKIPRGTDIWSLAAALESLPGIYLARPVPKPMPLPALPPGSYQSQQGYLNAASNNPSGVNALYAWTQTGGTGAGVIVCDLEYSWNYNHADLTQAPGSQINPNAISDPFNDNNHGTAVIGELVSDNNGWGTTGICYGATLKTCGTYWTSGIGWDIPGAITYAIAAFSAGDIILLEQQWEYTSGTQNFIPIEWWTDYSPNQQSYNGVYAAIVTAIANGIHVVEAGGNGNVNTQNLQWYGNSGAIIVGAGGASTTNNLQRLSFSSYGPRFDLQGWGENVFTTGYGTYYSSEGPNYYYRSDFSGTSSASPIVAGALACALGYYNANISTVPPTPSFMRSHLATYGTSQVSGPSGNIGPRPDIQAAIINFPPPQTYYDWGDAPDLPYPTLSSNNGAYHLMDGITYLGYSVDAENNGQPNATASGDDNDGNNDDDGVIFTSQLIPGQTASVQVTASVAGWLNAWIDFNGLNAWADQGEFIFQNIQLNAGVNNLTFPVPPVAVPGQTFARFRFNTSGGILFYGNGGPGEVEDYQVLISGSGQDAYDWGDAPDGPYPTLNSSNGARHLIVPGIIMGVSIDSEPDGQPDPMSLGDDSDLMFPPPNDDEDGVVFQGPLIPGQPANINVTVSVQGFLNVWFDFNHNGSWLDPGEHIFPDILIPAGANPLVMLIPPAALTGQTYARFRFSTVQGLSFTGNAPDGEVEDYAVNIELQPEEFDWGDAPDGPYPTLGINNGARHKIVPGFMLGASIDPEPDGQPDPMALGDDNDILYPPPNDDEDGVVFTSSLISGQIATLNVTASVNGLLNAWIDFNMNGNWIDPGEQIFTDLMLVPGVNQLSFPVPAALAAGQTFARFRFSSLAGLSFTGMAPDGEVEDYAVNIELQPEEFDWGDAPDGPYPTLGINNGARHKIVPGFMLGASIDPEPDGQPDPMALGDDNDILYPPPNYDEDGVTFNWPLRIGSPGKITVTVNGGGLINAWIDFNRNGNWDQAGEHILVDFYLVPGTHELGFIVPAWAIVGHSFARFRLSNQPGLSYTGPADDGEVEDYMVMIEENPELKWKQHPDAGRSGLHAHDYINNSGITESIILADDWLCNGGRVTGIRWWGNYELNAALQEKRGAGISHFHLSIHADDPSGTCRPADPEIQGFDVPFSSVTEQFTGMQSADGSPVYLYEYILPQAFMQEAGNRYWLDIRAIATDPANPAIWRWQESMRSMIPILCGAASKTLPAPATWSNITWTGPQGWLYTDLAFEIINLPDKTLNLKFYLEGLYNGSGTMNKAQDVSGDRFGSDTADVVTLEFHDASGYQSTVYTVSQLAVNTGGQASVSSIPYWLNGNYYITIRHRNSIETTSSGPVSFTGNNISYDFSTAASQAYGNNLKNTGGFFVIFGGDVNQDGSVDTADMTPVDNDASAFATGYLATDVNGDGTVDTGDMTIIDNNAAGFVSSITP